MYHYFTRATEKRILQALRFCFDSNPTHRDVVKNIREKFEFDERPQKGIILQASSVSPQPLSSDNYLGVLYSHCMLALVDGYRGTCVEWVRENDGMIQGGGFPSDPGVYYIQIEEVPDATGNLPDFQFWVDPLLTIREESLITFQTGNETQAFLMYAPVLKDSVRLFSPSYGPLLSGTSFYLEAAQSLYIGESVFGLEKGQVPAVLPTNDGPFTIVNGANDILDIEVDGVPVTAVLNPGTYSDNGVDISLQNLANQIQTALDLADVGATISVKGTGLEIVSKVSIRVEDDLTSTANTVFGFTEGYVAVSYEGLMTPAYVSGDVVLPLVVDGVPYQVEIPKGPRSHADIAQDISTQVPTLTVTPQDAGDFSLNPTTGEITFLHPFLPGTEVRADYRFPQDSRGPYPLNRGELSNTDAIPGVVIAFGNHLIDGDVVAVVVDGRRSDTARVYGGKAEISMDVDILARDSRTRNEMADSTVMYFWQTLRERLTEEGITITNVSMGGKSEEPYDDNADDYFYAASISLSLMTDWEVYEARPLYIQQVTPYTYAQDAKRAGTGTLLEAPDGFTLGDSAPFTYALPSFERIR